MTYRVVLADDVPAIIRGLIKMIPWERLELEFVGEAKNGDDLLQVIEILRPDIVISDIAMPGRSGIDVLKELRERGLHPKVIYISAYREFNYAQDALKYGAVDYLIKPIDRVRLEQLLEQTVHQIKKEDGAQKNEKRLIDLEQRQKRQQLEDALSRLAVENLLHELPLIRRELGSEDDGRLFTVVAIDLDLHGKHTGSWQEGEKGLLHFAIHNLIDELAADRLEVWPVNGSGSYYIILRHERLLDVVSVLQEWHAKVSKCLKLSITFAPGEAVSLNRLHVSCMQAAALLPYKFYVGVNRVITSQTVPGCSMLSEQEREQQTIVLVKALLTGDENRAVKLLTSCTKDLAALSWGNREYTMTLLNGLLKRLYDEVRQAGFETTRSEKEYVDKLFRAETIHDAIRNMEILLTELSLAIHEKGMTKEHVLFQRIKEYILENYVEDITLESLSARFYMNPYYLSTFFKRHMGQNFKQFVTEVRLKKATQLMAGSEDMLYEIAERVGFHNSRQFSELFKKHYGVLPNDYRKNFELANKQIKDH